MGKSLSFRQGAGLLHLLCQVPTLGRLGLQPLAPSREVASQLKGRGTSSWFPRRVGRGSKGRRWESATQSEFSSGGGEGAKMPRGTRVSKGGLAPDPVPAVPLGPPCCLASPSFCHGTTEEKEAHQ